MRKTLLTKKTIKLGCLTYLLACVVYTIYPIAIDFDAIPAAEIVKTREGHFVFRCPDIADPLRAISKFEYRQEDNVVRIRVYKSHWAYILARGGDFQYVLPESIPGEAVFRYSYSGQPDVVIPVRSEQ